jgi:hypothetical protein
LPAAWSADEYVFRERREQRAKSIPAEATSARC